MSGPAEIQGERFAPLPAANGSFLIEDGSDRARMMDMDRRLRPVRQRTLLVLAGALALAAPWAGWWTLAPLALAGVVFRVVEGPIQRASHPEFWLFGAWAGTEMIIAGSLLLTGEFAISMLVLLAIPVVTLSARFSSRGIWAGVVIAITLILGVAALADLAAIIAKPPLVIAPVAVVVAASMLTTPLMRSDVEHRDKAVLDPLTGLLNRNSLETRTKELEHQSTVRREPVAVVLLDLDDFKRTNDSLGHAAGDAVLKEVAHRLQRGLRSYDLIYRIGGDELLVLVPGADLERARVVGQQARLIVRQASTPRSDLPVSASCGVAASHPGEPFNFKAVFACADRALYTAKSEDGLAACETGSIEHFGAVSV